MYVHVAHQVSRNSSKSKTDKKSNQSAPGNDHALSFASHLIWPRNCTISTHTLSLTCISRPWLRCAPLTHVFVFYLLAHVVTELPICATYLLSDLHDWYANEHRYYTQRQSADAHLHLHAHTHIHAYPLTQSHTYTYTHAHTRTLCSRGSSPFGRQEGPHSQTDTTVELHAEANEGKGTSVCMYVCVSIYLCWHVCRYVTAIDRLRKDVILVKYKQCVKELLWMWELSGSSSSHVLGIVSTRSLTLASINSCLSCIHTHHPLSVHLSHLHVIPIALPKWISRPIDLNTRNTAGCPVAERELACWGHHHCETYSPLCFARAHVSLIWVFYYVSHLTRVCASFDSCMSLFWLVYVPHFTRVCPSFDLCMSLIYLVLVA